MDKDGHIEGATDSTLELNSDLAGKALTVTVTYTDGYGAFETVTSDVCIVQHNVNDLSIGPNADLSGIALIDHDFGQIDLTGANLSGAFLAGARLRQSNLTDTDMSGVNLTLADLYQSNFSGADLTGADLG